MCRNRKERPRWVVGTCYGGTPEALVDGVTGHVVPARDPERLADCLERLLTDPAERRRMGAAGRARVTSDFSSEVMAGEVSALYAQLRRGA